VERVREFDADQARQIHQQLVQDSASMRSRIAERGQQLQERVMQRILTMKPEEINQLTAYEVCLLLRCGTSMEIPARDFGEALASEGRFHVPPGLATPTFMFEVVRPGCPEGIVPVCLPSGEAGYILRDRVDDFKRDFPDAHVLI